MAVNEATFRRHWKDVSALLKVDGNDGNVSHPELKNSYRKAVVSELHRLAFLGLSTASCLELKLIS